MARRRGHASAEVTLDDLERALQKLRVLGKGYTLVVAGGRRLVQSVPTELNTDHTAILAAAAATGGCVVLTDPAAAFAAWPAARRQTAMDQLVQEGMAWVDDQEVGDRAYWFPSLLPGRPAAASVA